jgi:hypothetical protein
VRALALLAAVGLVAGCSPWSGGGASREFTTAELNIAVWPEGKGGPVTRSTLTCPAEDYGRASICGSLEHELFNPVPGDVACAEVYGGPEVAEVHGTLDGRRIDATFNKTNACEIARWNRVQFLFPGTP